MSDCKKCLCLNACQEHYAVSESHGIRNHDQCKCFINKDEYVEVVHGSWETGFDSLGWLKHTCTNCGYVKRTDVHVRLGWNYCPKCGAKMDLEE